MSGKANTPKKAGHYWAQWRVADDGTPEGEEQTPSMSWEVVQVFENCDDTDDPEHLRVSVPGQAKSQSIENFFWGPGPLDLARAYYTPATELQFRYDVRAALGWNDKTSLDILLDGVKRLKRSHDDLLAAMAELMPDGWADDETMDHMPGIKAARLVIAKAQLAP